MENNTVIDQKSQNISNILEFTEKSSDPSENNSRTDYEDMPPLIDDIEYIKNNETNNILKKLMMEQFENIKKYQDEYEKSEYELDKDIQEELNELTTNDFDNDNDSYVLSFDGIPICCSSHFDALQKKSDELIKETVAKYMDSNNVYVSNNGKGDYSISVLQKNSIWPVEKCVGRFIISKVKYV
jgi:hypothetical protein